MYQPGLYLVPANTENLWTIREGVDRNKLKQFLSISELSAIENVTQNTKSFYCWAMTKPNRSKFNAMQQGDIVLFSEKGTGKFTYMGSVSYKVENQALGEELWSFVPGEPWKLIYFLSYIKSININKSALVTALGYRDNYIVPGTIRVGDERLIVAIKSKGNIQSLLEEISGFGSEVNELPVQKYTQAEHREYIRPNWLERVIKDIETLRQEENHQERAHEALVQSFLQSLGFTIHKDIVFQLGRVDILIKQGKAALAVVEVKKEWGLANNKQKALEQAFRYAQKNAARFVVISNGDYYAYYDRQKGLSYEDQFMQEFTLTRLTNGNLRFIRTISKEALLRP